MWPGLYTTPGLVARSVYATATMQASNSNWTSALLLPFRRDPVTGALRLRKRCPRLRCEIVWPTLWQMCSTGSTYSKANWWVSQTTDVLDSLIDNALCIIILILSPCVFVIWSSNCQRWGVWTDIVNLIVTGFTNHSFQSNCNIVPPSDEQN